MYSLAVAKPVANLGVSVLSEGPGVRVDPFVLGAQDEASVQGFAGSPVDVNPLTYDYLDAISSAGASLPAAGRYYVAVDSGRDRFDGSSYGGRYVLRSWVNDVTPPSVRLLTQRVSTGRPTIAVRTLDGQSGVDPASLAIGYRGILVGASRYDPATGVATFPLPTGAPALKRGTLQVRLASSDYEEAKNVDTTGTAIMPNTRTASVTLRVVAGPAVSWLLPGAGACVAGRQQLLLAASAPAGVRSVRVLLDGHRVAAAAKRGDRTWLAHWRAAGARKGRHVLTAVVVDRASRAARVTLRVRRCGS